MSPFLCRNTTSDHWAKIGAEHFSPSEQRGPPQPSQHAFTVLFTTWLSISGGLRLKDKAKSTYLQCSSPPWIMGRTVAAGPSFDSLVQETGSLGPLPLEVQGDAIVAAVPDAHPVHIQPPAPGVVPVHLGAADVELQARRQDALRPLLHRALTPASASARHIKKSFERILNPAAFN